MQFFKSCFIAIAALFISSCSSDDDNNESFGVTTGDYLPLTVNNSWKYLNTSQSLLNEIKIIGTDEFKGNTYYKFTDDSEVPPLVIQHWFAKKGASYFLKTGDTTASENGITITLKSYEMVILKDDFPVNTTWSGTVSPKVTYSGNGSSGTLPFKVSYTGVNYFKGATILDGITYPNVIKTKVSVIINANNQITNASEEYWFAENIGIIKFITNDGNSIQETNIDSYILN